MRGMTGARALRVVAAAASGVLAFALFAGVAMAVAPPPPTNLVATDTTLGHSVSLTWLPAFGAASYQVQYKRSSAPTWTLMSPNVATTGTVIDGLDTLVSYDFKVYAVNVGGEISAGWAGVVSATPTDKTPPNTSIVVNPPTPDGKRGWYWTYPSYAFFSDEPLSGLWDSLDVTPVAGVNPVSSQLSTGMPGYLLAEGSHKLKWTASDSYANTSAVQQATIAVDTHNPWVAANVSAGAGGTNGWYTSNATVTITSNDVMPGSGPHLVWYSLDGAATSSVTYAGPVVLPNLLQAGAHTYSTYAEDWAGHTSTVTTLALKFDPFPPSQPGTPTLTARPAGAVDISWAGANDPVSGMSAYRLEYSPNPTFAGAVATTLGAGVTTASIGPGVLTDGTIYYFRVFAVDDAGNRTVSGVSSFIADATSPLITLQPPNVTPVAKGSVVVTASVVDTSSGFFRLDWRVYRTGTAPGAFSTVFTPTTLFPIPEGDWTLEVVAYDVAGNSSATSGRYQTDNTAPTSTLALVPAAPNGLAGWYTSVSGSISATDPGGSGVAALFVNAAPSPNPCALVPLQGVNPLTFYAVDAVGNAETPTVTSYKLDSVPPTVTVNSGGYDTVTGPFARSVTITFSVVDTSSGPARIEYQYVPRGSGPTAVWTSVPAASTQLSLPEGNWTVYARAYDVAGNVSANWSGSARVDASAPVSSLGLVPPSPNGQNGWYTSVAGSVSATDFAGAGVAALFVNGAPAPNPCPIVPAQGLNTFTFFAIDAVGNAELSHVATFALDSVAPVLSADSGGYDTTAGAFARSVTVTFSATDAASGVSRIEYQFQPRGSAPGATWTAGAGATPAVTVPEGNWTLYARAYDVAGNVSAMWSGNIRIDLTPPTSRLNLVPLVPNGLALWYRNIAASVSATDPAGSGVASLMVNGSARPNPYALAPVQGLNTVTYYAIDAVGNTESSHVGTFALDGVAPTLTVDAGAYDTTAGAFARSVVITFSAADAVSAVWRIQYQAVPRGNAAGPTWTTIVGGTVTTSVPEGNWTIYARAEDVAGNYSATWSGNARVDATAPVSTITLAPPAPNGSNNWYRAIAGTISATDAGGSGVATLMVNGVARANPYALASVQGTNTWTFYSVDGAGNSEAPTTTAYKLDSVAPTFTVDAGGYDTTAGPFATAVTVNLSASDGMSGVAWLQYQFQPRGAPAGASWTQVSVDATSLVVPEGDWTLYARAFDLAGNHSPIWSGNAHVDATPPVTTMSLVPAAPNGTGGWYTSVAGSISATDGSGSGVATLFVNGAPVANPFALAPVEGINTYTCYAVDAAGNTGSATTSSFNLDSIAPDLLADTGGYDATAAPLAASAGVTFTASDAGSGVSAIEYQLLPSGSPMGATWTSVSGGLASIDVPGGDWTLYARSVDAAGNHSAVWTGQFSLDSAPPVTTLSSNPGAPDGPFGESWMTPPDVTLSATDASSGVGGTYLRWDGNGGFVSATSTTAPSSTGTHTLEFYSQDNLGNTEAVKSLDFYVDTQPTAASATIAPGAPDGAAGWWVTQPSITLAGSSGAGIARIAYACDSPSGPWSDYSSPILDAPQGDHTITYQAFDVDGRRSAPGSVSYKLDTVPPDVGPASTNMVSSQPIGFTVSDDGSGLSDAWADGPGMPHAGSLSGGLLTVPTGGLPEGSVTLTVTAMDVAGNTTARAATILVDTTPPITTCDAKATYVSPGTIHFNATDGGSGVAYTQYSIDGGDPVTGGSVTVWQTGTHTLGYWSVDVLGNTEAPNSITFRVSPKVTRVASKNRYSTAIAISRSSFSSAGSVVVAAGGDYPDALVAAGLAGAVQGPILLTPRDSLPTGLLGEISRLGAHKVFIVGGTGSVSSAVQSTLARTYTVERIAGATRFEVAANVAKRVQQLAGGSWTGEAFVARGDSFADALSCAPYAYSQRMPILLTMPTSLSSQTSSRIRALHIGRVHVVGGNAAVSPAVYRQLQGTGAACDRISASNRYALSASVAERAIANGWASPDYVAATSGTTFPDALAGGAAIGSRNGIMLLTDPNALSVDAAHELSRHKAEIRETYIYGGVVSPSVVTQILGAL